MLRETARIKSITIKGDTTCWNNNPAGLFALVDPQNSLVK